jgi:NADH-quinone oxidoreductase subunit K
MLLKQLLTNFILFVIATLGIILNRRHVLVILICIEILLLSINVNFLLLSNYFDDIYGHLFAFIILTVAASESAIGLAIIILYYRTRYDVSIIKNVSLKG